MISDKVQIKESKTKSNIIEVQKLKKNITKFEKQIIKLSHEEQELRSQLESVAYNHEALTELTQKIAKIRELRITIEDEWMNTSANLEK